MPHLVPKYATKVEVELTPTNQATLQHWASVGRTFSAVERLLDNYPVNTDTEEDLIDVTEELKELHPALENLHQAYRSALNKALSDPGNRIAAEIGIKSDGFQKGVGYQFTDPLTGTTFYGNTVESAKANLGKIREKYAASKTQT